MYTEAQKRATIKYQKENLKRIPLDVKTADKERYEQAAKAAGMSLRAFILEAIEEKIFNETLKGTFEQVAHREAHSTEPKEQP